MDKKITDFIVKEIKIGKYMLAPIDMLLLIFAPIFSVMVSSCVSEYTAISLPTFVRIAPYMKVASGIFDAALAILAAFYVYELTGLKVRAYLAYAIVLMLPVLRASCAMWGMGDSIYVFFIVLSLYCLEKNKSLWAFIFYAIALFLCRYAFFVLPIFAIAFFQKKAKLYYFLLPFCGVWFRSGIVAKSGYLSFPIFEMDRLFLRMRPGTLLSYNWPNIYELIGTDAFMAEYGKIGKGMAAAIMILIVAIVLIRMEKNKTTDALPLAVLLSMLIPFVMPQMDERSGILCCILSVILAMKNPKLYMLPIVECCITYIAFSAYFRGESVIPLCYVAFVNLFLILVMIRYTFEKEILSFGFTRE